MDGVKKGYGWSDRIGGRKSNDAGTSRAEDPWPIAAREPLALSTGRNAETFKFLLPIACRVSGFPSIAFRD